MRIRSAAATALVAAAFVVPTAPLAGAASGSASGSSSGSGDLLTNLGTGSSGFIHGITCWLAAVSPQPDPDSCDTFNTFD
ncbi:hypothetical protein [Nocardia arthritidis]|uniref:Secreted protein n=1 Tax=Nocardia arthritidis TaxID=228602 RepID=A0A6G9YA71_9NOCA|nr:hypothetical protein [Nocardia arthritidis]QIS10129.1 hypothetical protein F5544_11175 [Nocardia arthritidis]